MSSIRFRCYYCYRIHQDRVGSAGREKRCVCGKIMVVPAESPVGLPPSRLPVATAPAAGDRVSGVGGRSSGDGPEETSERALAVAAYSGEERAQRRAVPIESEEIVRIHGGEPDADEKERHTMGKAYLMFAGMVAGLWLIHTSPWIYFGLGTKPLPEQLGIVEHTHYFTLERAFWSTVIAGLALALFFEGLSRLRRSRRIEEQDLVDEI